MGDVSVLVIEGREGITLDKDRVINVFSFFFAKTIRFCKNIHNFKVLFFFINNKTFALPEVQSALYCIPVTVLCTKSALPSADTFHYIRHTKRRKNKTMW